MKEINIEGSKLHILPIIHGLVGEEKKVEKAFEKFKPDCIAIGVSPEDIEILRNIKKIKADEIEMSLQHQYYLMHLSKYGKISLPPPDLKTAHEIADKHKIPLKAIDIDDSEYADLLVENVSIFSLIRYSRKIKKLGRKQFKAKDAEEFVYEWEKEISSIKSFKKIEEIREERMVENIVRLCKEYKKILTIVPMEKYKNILLKLERYKK